MMTPWSRLVLSALLAVAPALAAPAARADDATSACLPIAVAVCPSLALGEFAPNSAGPSVGAVLSASVPHIPAPYIPQIAIAVPFRGPGKYAATAELRTTGDLYAGAGLGVGNLDGFGQSGLTVVALAGVRIVPNVSLVGRYYFGGKSGSGNSGFFGVRFGF